MSASCSAADGQINARRWWRAQCICEYTYMAWRRVCTVGRLLRCRWLPMGGELAVAALVLGEHGEVRWRAKQRVVVVDGCLIKCHPKNVELSRRHEPVQQTWAGARSLERELVVVLVVREILSRAGEVSQILAGRKDGCRSERWAVQNGRQLQGQGTRAAATEVRATARSGGIVGVGGGGEVRGQRKLCRG
jgi:hypothetical protein